MAINFPSNPNVNDTHTVGSTVWTWNGTSWTAQSHDPIEIATLTYPSVDGTAGQALTTDGAGNLSFTNVSADLVSDTTPQLGGDLDMNGKSFSTNSGSSMKMGPSGSFWFEYGPFYTRGLEITSAGAIVINESYTLPDADGTAGQVLTTDGSGNLSFADASSGGGGTLGASISGVEESFSVIENATGTVTHDCDDGHIFYHKTPSADWTVNLTNLGLTNHYATAITIIIQQGATAYIPSALQIGGSSTGIRWASDATPTGNANSTDQVTFSIMTDGTTTFALGQLSTYGEGTGTLSAPSTPSSSLAWQGDRAIFKEGGNSTLHWMSIQTGGSANGFGYGGTNSQEDSVISNGTIAIIANGIISNVTANVLNYVNFATLGDAQSVGTTYDGAQKAGVSDGTTGLFAGGWNGSAQLNTIHQFTIATSGNSSSFGTLSAGRYGMFGVNDNTYGVFAGNAFSANNNIDYVTIATPGNSASFGSLSTSRGLGGSLENNTRGIFAGGEGSNATVDYITIATPGNATATTDLTTGGTRIGGATDQNIGLLAGGNLRSGTVSNINIDTLAQADNFGTIQDANHNGASGSSS